ncbi:MAG TPA: S8/S53 family peptidase [Mycobacteriales bacterium]|nr:S8/S53 family peptidase [Mycobacteriales bacterium]
MSLTRWIRPALAIGLLAATLGPLHLADAAPAPRQSGPDDAVVVAVIDFGISPYHWDYLASKMPQAQNRDRSDDLPLRKPPHTWLPGFPKPSAFASYNRLDLTLDEVDDGASLKELDAADKEKWAKVQPSSVKEQHVYWMPGTKIIGSMAWAAEDTPRGTMIRNNVQSAHGTGSNSVSVGNLNGTCPECLLFFIDLENATVAEGEDAINWAMKQSWIDVITNSYGYSAAERDRLYDGSDVELQRTATERGQTVLFSAGNGHGSAFTVPNQTLMSSQEGPDWIVTVGATDPKHNRNYPGAGKPADIAGVGSGYPSAYNASSTTNGATFGGTSNATPTIAGTYSRALYLSRRQLAGPSRIQAKGVIATGRGSCGPVRRDCELRDGVLTGAELRNRLFQGATPSNGGFTDLTSTAQAPKAADERYFSEGHGTYRARLNRPKTGDGEWLAEFQRLWGPLSGTAAVPARPADERDWMLVDSWCRQQIWGPWNGGYFVKGKTALPGPSPTAPSRTAYQQGCTGQRRPPY